MADVILTLNAGSSSIKFAIYRIGERGELEIDKQGQLEGMGSRPHLVVEEESGDVILDRTEVGLAGDGTKSLAVVIRRLLEAHHLVAVGHRVVHGGAQFSGPVIVTADAMQQLESLVPLAPLHQPFNLAPIREVAREFPDVPQVACFDTAFHHGHPAVADFFALPRSLHAQGIRRYGFHGLSYEYIMRTLPAAAPDIAGKRVVVAHLGSGASLCATRDFKSVDCTLSFTALGGLPMGTRSGDLDPGVLLYLLQQEQMSVADLEKLLYKDSGLKGVSGVSNDMRDLESSADPNAAFAVDLFTYRVAYELAGLASALGGIDGVVFTAGIGEHSKRVRAEVLRRSAWLGVSLDAARNDQGGPRLTTDESAVASYVIPTDEQIMIAVHTASLTGVLGRTVSVS